MYNKMYAKIRKQTVDASGLTGYISRRVFSTKLRNMKEQGRVTHSLWDRLICNRIRKMLGGKVRLMGTGSAPLDPEVLEFLRVTNVSMQFISPQSHSL
jgi:long-chain acyl-CoA synthetase